MCYMVYLASDVPLPLIDWNEDRPGISVEELSPEDQVVRKQFSKPNVYYVGSWQRCGCGFRLPLDKDTRRSRDMLGEYLRAALADQGIVELHTCWAHDEASPAEHHFEYTVAELEADAEFPDERVHYLIRQDRGVDPQRS